MKHTKHRRTTAKAVTLVVGTLVLLVLCRPSLCTQVASGSLLAGRASGSGAHEVQGTLQKRDSQEANRPQHPSSAPQQQDSGQATSDSPSATIVGTVTDVNDDPVPGATVVLQGPVPADRRTVTSNENGFFEIHDIKPGIPYHVVASSEGFADWTSPVLILAPGQYEILTGSKLRIEKMQTTVTVTPRTSEEIAIEQVRMEEKQRGFGFIPNFFEVFDPHPAPLTAKLKFSLSFRVVTDPVNMAGVGFLAGVGQTTGTIKFADGWEAFGQRFGANYANQFTDIMIGAAILPTLLHQDPRYYYQGTGSKKSRALHAISNVVITKGDNGRTQLNYSGLGGDLASAAISNAYYPQQNRGASLVFTTFAINIAVHIGARLVQEFVFRPSR